MNERQELSLERSDGVTLRGTLSLPNRAVERNLPVIVAAHGSGIGVRDFPLYDHLRDTLTANGIATLVYDRRGEGASTGDLSIAGIELLADDLRAWVERLRSHPALDPERVGLWGISQGGWLAPQAAADDGQVACVIALSPSGVSPAEQMIHAADIHIRNAGYPASAAESARQARLRIDAFYRGENSYEDARAAYVAASHEPWFRHAFLVEPLQTSTRWQLMMDYDVRPALARLAAPSLVIFGDRDVWVPVERGAEIWDATLPASTPREIVIIPGMYHYPTYAPAPNDSTEAGPIAPEYERALISFLRRWLRVAPGA